MDPNLSEAVAEGFT